MRRRQFLAEPLVAAAPVFRHGPLPPAGSLPPASPSAVTAAGPTPTAAARRDCTRGPARDPAGDPAAQHGARAVLPPGPRADRGRPRRRAPADLPAGRAGRPPPGPDRGRDATRHQHQLLDHLEWGTALPDKPVMLSFDDASGGQYTNALPILQRQDAGDVLRHDGRPRPAELALPRRCPGSRRRRDDDRLPHLGPPPRHKVRGSDWATQLEKPRAQLERSSATTSTCSPTPTACGTPPRCHTFRPPLPRGVPAHRPTPRPAAATAHHPTRPGPVQLGQPHAAHPTAPFVN